MRMKNKLYLTLMLVFLSLLLAFSFLLAHYVREYLETEKIVGLNIIANEMSNDIEDSIKAFETDINILKNASILRANLSGLAKYINDRNNPLFINSTANINNSLYVSFVKEKGILDLMLLDTEGRVLYSAFQRAGGPVLGEKVFMWVEGNLNKWSKNTCVSGIFEHADVHEVIITAPLLNNENKLEGFLVFEVGLNRICKSILKRAAITGKTEEILMRIKEGNELHYYKINISGDAIRISSSLFPESWDVVELQKDIMNNALDSQMKKVMQFKGRDAKRIDYRGVNVLAARRYIPLLNLEFMLKVDEDEILAPIYYLRNIGIFLILIFVGLALVIVNIISRRFTNSIVRLIQVTKDIGEGRFDLKTEIYGTDEIGTLSRAFKDMALTLSKTTVSLNVLKKSEQHISAILGNIPDIAWLKDQDGRFIAVNESFGEACGVKPEDLVGKTDLDVWPKEFAERYRADDQEVIKNGKRKTVEEPLADKEGKTLFIETIKTPVFNHRGEAIGTVGISRDVTERKRIEQDLRKSEMYYRSLFENMIQGYAYCKVLFKNNEPRDCICLNVNKSFEKLTGLKNVIGRSLTDVIPGIRESHPEILEIYGRVALGGISENFEVYLDTIGWLSISVYSPEKGYFIAVFDNITSRKEAEITLKESEERFRNLFENSTDLIQAISPDGHILYVNPSWCSTLGYSKEEAINRPLFDIIHPGVVQHCMKIFQHLMTEEGNAEKITATLIAKDGKLITIEGNCSCKFRDGRPLVATGIFRDITKQKQMEAVIEHDNDIQRVVSSLLKFSLSSMTVEEFLKKALDEILSIKWFLLESKGCIFLVEDEPEMLVMKTHKGFAECLQTKCRKLPFGKCLCGRAALTKGIEFADRVDERHEIHYEGMPGHGHYCVPIMHLGKVLGVLNTYLREGFEQRNEETEKFLLMISDTLAMVIAARQAEAMLKESEERFKQVTEVSGEWIWEVDANGLYTFASAIVEKILGYKPEELIGKKHFYDFFHPDDQGSLKKMALEIMARKEPFHEMENRNINKNGETRWMLTTGVPLFGDGEDWIGYRGVDRDITESKDKEEFLRYQTALFEAQLNSSGDGIKIVNNQRKVIVQNQRTIELWRIPKNIANDDDDQVQIQYAKNMTKNPELFVEKIDHLYAHPDEISNDEIELINGTVLETYSSRVVGKNGKLYGRIWVFHDITERKQAEKEVLAVAKEQLFLKEQISQSEKMAAIGRVSEGMAHEINQPLCAMNLIVETMVSAVKKRKYDKLEASSRVILSQVEHISRIISQFRSFSRMTREANPEFVGFLNAIKNAVSLLNDSLKSRGINPKLNIANGVTGINCRGTEIEQVLINVINNAIHAVSSNNGEKEIAISAET